MEETAARNNLLSALRSGWRLPASLQRFYADAAWLQQLATEELRPRPGRIRTSVRMAFIAAVGTALMAALHIGGALGAVTLWVALYASSALMSPSEGLNHPLGYVYGLAFPKDTRLAATGSGGVDPALMRYSVKLGLAATLGYVVGVASHRSELGVIVWTAVIAGLPTYGGTVRKMILRRGEILGGIPPGRRIITDDNMGTEWGEGP